LRKYKGFLGKRLAAGVIISTKSPKKRLYISVTASFVLA